MSLRRSLHGARSADEVGFLCEVMVKSLTRDVIASSICNARRLFFWGGRPVLMDRKAFDRSAQCATLPVPPFSP